MRSRPRRSRVLAAPFVAVLVAAAAGCVGPLADREAAVRRADTDRALAMVAVDEAALQRALHPTLTYTHANGHVDTKQSLIESLVSGRVQYRSINVSSPEIRVHGTSAVVTAPVHMVVAAGPRILDLQSIYTAVYWHDGGRWQLAAYQSSPVAPPEQSRSAP